MKNRWTLLTLGLWLLALLMVGWTFRHLPLDDIVSGLGLLTGSDWLLWSLINVLILYFAVQRWQLLGRALQAPLSLAALFRLRQAGGTVSFLTPGPHFGGEPLQLWWLCRDYRLPLHRAMAMLGFDRFMETGTNIAVLLAGVMVLLGSAILPVGEWLQISVILATLLCLLCIAALLVLRHPAWLAYRFRQLALRWQSDRQPDNGQCRWERLAGELRSTLSRQKRRLWLALLLSLGGWAALLLELVLLLQFLGLSPSPSGIVLIMVGMRLAMLLPIPGGLGTIEASLLWSFRFLGLPMAAAAGLIALIRLRDIVVLLVGLGCLASLHRPVSVRRQTQS